MKTIRWIYPSTVGLLLGILQTGLYFQLSFTLSSNFRTFLMITVCWLLGSVIGIRIAPKVKRQLNSFIVLAICAYFACVFLLGIAPFHTRLWPIYALLIVLTGLYPGIFFVVLGKHYRAGELFLKENNGFIGGMVLGTQLFLLVGRIALWIIPLVIAAFLAFSTNRLLAYLDGLDNTQLA